MKIEAPAKVNLILNILGKREDGYHEIETLMQAIDLSDTVELTTTKGSGIWISAPGSQLNCGPTNLAYKAADLMLKEFNKKEHINITIEKRIPIAGGLGGGSADAAAVINLLADIWGIKDKKKLYAIGSQLGSDVPFMMAAQRGKTCAIARGRGTDLEFVPSPNIKVELKILNIFVRNKTKAVYGELKPEDYAIRYDIQKFLNAPTIAEKEALMGNVLQAPAFRVFRAAGYNIPEYPPHLSGAGPTLFAVIE